MTWIDLNLGPLGYKEGTLTTAPAVQLHLSSCEKFMLVIALDISIPVNTVDK